MKQGENCTTAENSAAQSAPATTARRLTLNKGEKLRHRSLVDTLFKEGKSIYEFPLKVMWRTVDRATLDNTFRDHVPDRIGALQMLITVPKKKRRHAVDRVLMRRRIREAYRLNRKDFLCGVEDNPDIRSLSMAFIYIHDKNLPYSTIERKMRLLLKKLSEKISGDNGKTADPR